MAIQIQIFQIKVYTTLRELFPTLQGDNHGYFSSLGGSWEYKTFRRKYDLHCIPCQENDTKALPLGHSKEHNLPQELCYLEDEHKFPRTAFLDSMNTSAILDRPKYVSHLLCWVGVEKEREREIVQVREEERLLFSAS